MAQRVADDLYRELGEQLKEIRLQLRRKSGYTFDPAALKSYLQKGVEGKFDGVASAHRFVHDKTKDGWTLIGNTQRHIASVRDLEVVPFLKKGEDYISGEEMLRRARVELDANYDEEDAEYVLEHQYEIPEEFRPYYLIFPGTGWLDLQGIHNVPALYWNDERWNLGFFWLTSGWRSLGRFVRPRK